MSFGRDQTMLHLPQPFSSIPFYRLSYSHPSPIHALPGLTKHLNSKLGTVDTSQLWTKREDQAGPLACYGNKYRKFEYIIPDIQSSPNVTTLVSEGALQSNHTVQVAAMAKVLGLKCHLLLHRGIGGLRKAQDQEAYACVGNVQLNKLLGANIITTDESDTGDETGPMLPLLDDLRSEGEIPYWISSGASLHPLGGLGYARCAFEILSQEEELAANGMLKGTKLFDRIFVACGSGSTFAGLIAGFKLLQKMKRSPSREIIGVLTSPTKNQSYHQERILRLARQTGELIGLDSALDITASDVLLDERFVGEGYGIFDQGVANAIGLAAQLDGFVLDPVYTAKVMQSAVSWKYGESKLKPPASPESNALFIHTGGTNALSAYAEFARSSTSSGG